MPAIKTKEQGKIQRLITIAFLLSTEEEMHLDELSKRLAITTKELEDDLNMLMFIGLPPYSPGELFDIYIEDQYVSMRFNDVFLKPLRLTAAEKADALIALKKLSAQGLYQSEISNVIELIDEQQGTTIDIDAAPSANIGSIIDAISKLNLLEIEYFSLNSANISRRQVEPYKLFTTASTDYLFAYCLSSYEFKIFRVDRVIDLTVLDQTFSIRQFRDDSNSDFQDDEIQTFSLDKDNYVDLKVSKNAYWIIDSIPCEEIDESSNIYRFYTNSSYFIARLLISNSNDVSYITGTIDKTSIVNAVKEIQSRINNLEE